ncbi:MAG: threonine/serine dehydratase [Planctomycetes bacterium]|nr:threonine/serine dehydratase [Planctomycetota bacterium]
MSSAPPPPAPPTLASIQQARRTLLGHVRETPAWQWRGHRIAAAAPQGATIWNKLELFQHAGSFKARGVMLRMLELDDAARERGVTAVSAGNHAMAVAYVARALGSHAKVVMPSNANPARVAACRALGAEIEQLDDIAQAFARVEEIERTEGRTFVHPFEGEHMARGAGTLAFEFLRQVGQLDAVIVPIGGGGLAAGVANAVKQLQPRCRVIGVEPEGADSMHRSFAAGSPQRIDKVTTIADSLGAPMAMPYSFSLCQRFVDELVKIDDDELCRAMWLLFADAKLAVEPAGAATTAAMLQLGDRLADQRVGLIVCGANIDEATFADCLRRGAPSA